MANARASDQQASTSRSPASSSPSLNRFQSQRPSESTVTRSTVVDDPRPFDRAGRRLSQSPTTIRRTHYTIRTDQGGTDYSAQPTSVGSMPTASSGNFAAPHPEEQSAPQNLSPRTMYNSTAFGQAAPSLGSARAYPQLPPTVTSYGLTSSPRSSPRSSQPPSPVLTRPQPATSGNPPSPQFHRRSNLPEE